MSQDDLDRLVEERPAVKNWPIKCALCRKGVVLGQWVVMTEGGPAHRMCARKGIK